MMQLIATDDEIDHEDEQYEKQQEHENEQELELELNQNSTNHLHDSNSHVDRTLIASGSIEYNSFPFFLNSNCKFISNLNLFDTNTLMHKHR